MKLSQLSDQTLLSNTRAIAHREQALALELIEHLLEVDQRKLFATLGYDSLFKYIVRELGYSEAIAYERLRAMRLVRRIPETREKLTTGALTLTTAAQVESFRKSEELSVSKTVELLEEASHKSKREVEVLLLSKSPDALPKERVRQVTETHQEARVVLNPRLQALLKRYEEIHGKRAISEILETLLEEHVTENDPAAPKATRTTATTKRRDIKSQSRYIPAQVRSELWRRSQGRCEWKDPKTGRRCECRYRLEKDHYPIPYAQGGSSTLENLRLTCRAHNERFRVEVFGPASPAKTTASASAGVHSIYISKL